MKKKSNSKKVFVVIAFVFLAVLFAGAFGAAVFAVSPLDSAADKKEIRFEIPAGTSVREVASRLKNDGIIRSEYAFYLAARYPVLTGRTHAFVLKSGVYLVSSTDSVPGILNLFESAHQVYIRTVFPEGLTTSKIAGLLENDEVCLADDFIAASRSEDLLREYGIPAENFEGYLFPDTYFFTPSMTGEAVLRMMVDNFFARVSEIDSLKNLSSLDLHKTVTLASIVEREYRVEAEAPLIASVFKNRLQAGMGLYSCATIEYVLTELQGKAHPDVITYKDLQIESPYNTYKWAGLTPGPISNPGIVALSAAANPPVTDYFYFRLTDSATGTHTFSKSFSAHMEAGLEFRTKKAAGK
ncbi:MAG: endolytic transglycosylase MltG [Treponema sp.]|nr:endolytic transglycosylase MltG [Treponema sp.]